MRTLFTTALAVIAASQVQAQSCADRTTVTERLKSGYGEKFAGGGLRNSESVFEVWLSEDHATWTILMTTPDGRTCVMAAGTNWRDALPEKAAGIPG